jgi:hypothetical protein
MNKLIAILIMVAGAALAVPSFGATSFSWNVEPGPYGGYRVSTSTGDYMVVVSGNSVWVGTEDEFDHERVKQLSARDGFTEFKVAGSDPHATDFVSSGLPSVRVGNYRLAGISTDILFGEKPNKRLHRPTKPTDAEYVQMVWVQSLSTATSAIVYDKTMHVSYSAVDCGTGDAFHYCEFVIPTAALTHNATVFFASAGAAPGALPIESIVKATYQSINDRNKPIGATPSAEDLAELRRLHEYDSSLPAPPG